MQRLVSTLLNTAGSNIFCRAENSDTIESMPELQEVETIRQGLAEKLVGHKIIAVEVRADKMFFGNPKALIGQTVVEMARRAKVLIWKLSDTFIITHLKMTGQLIFQPDQG